MRSLAALGWGAGCVGGVVSVVSVVFVVPGGWFVLGLEIQQQITSKLVNNILLLTL